MLRGKVRGWRTKVRREKKVCSHHRRLDSSLHRRAVSVIIRVKDKAMGP